MGGGSTMQNHIPRRGGTRKLVNEKEGGDI